MDDVVLQKGHLFWHVFFHRFFGGLSRCRFFLLFLRRRLFSRLGVRFSWRKSGIKRGVPVGRLAGNDRGQGLKDVQQAEHLSSCQLKKK